MAPHASFILSAFSLLLSSTAWISGGVNALPAPAKPPGLASLPALNSAQIASFRPYSNYADAAYCPLKGAWKCGKPCEANPNFELVASGGDGSLVQFWYVGIDPTLKTVVVGHQGTDPKKLLPILTDLDAPQVALNSKLFPGLPHGIMVHHGFAKAQANTAAPVLAAVQKALEDSKLNKVTIAGHSLGGAIALLDAVYLPLHLPGVLFKTYTYGQPRVGNAAFAHYVDQHVDIDRVINREDIVPIVPGRGLFYKHSKGEKHIQDDLSWLVCPGEDSMDPRCSVGDVKNIFDGAVKFHSGPYDGVMMGCHL